MKKAAQILGIIAGSLGVIAAILVMAVGAAFGGAMFYYGSGLLIAWGLLGLLLSGTVLAGGVMAEKNPLASGIIMLVCGVVNILFLGLYWLVLPFILCLVGGILVLVGRSQDQQRLAYGGGVPYMVAQQPVYAAQYGVPVMQAYMVSAPSAATPAAATPAAQGGVFCANCGTSNSPGAGFCGRCGTAIQMAVADAGSCQGCGAARKGTDQFCGACGASF